MAAVAESRLARNDLHRQPALLNQQSGVFQPQSLNGFGRRFTRFRTEQAAELPGADMNRIRNVFDGQRFAEIVTRIFKSRLQAVTAGESISISECCVCPPERR